MRRLLIMGTTDEEAADAGTEDKEDLAQGHQGGIGRHLQLRQGAGYQLWGQERGGKGEWDVLYVSLYCQFLSRIGQWKADRRDGEDFQKEISCGENP